MISIIDYGVGNLKSIQKAIELTGSKAVITSDWQVVSKARGMVLPGVGAFGPAMKIIKKNKIDFVFNEFVMSGKPVLGICLGMQLLFSLSEEGGINEGLGYFKGSVKKFSSAPGLKIPQMGWNTVEYQNGASSIFNGIKNNSFFYFVHSYVCFPEDKKIIKGTTDYGISFASFVEKNGVSGVQFHPEKSGTDGLKIIRNFIAGTVPL